MADEYINELNGGVAVAMAAGDTPIFLDVSDATDQPGGSVRFTDEAGFAAWLQAFLSIALSQISDATPNGRALVAASYAAMRGLLDLEPGTDFYSISAADSATAAAIAAEIGVSVQAYDADLTTWAGLTPSANAQSLVTAANYAAMRGLLDLEPGTDFYSISAADSATAAAIAAEIGVSVQAYDADLTTWAGLTPSANAQSLVTAANYAAMRGLLDLEPGTDFYSISAADSATAAAVANYTVGPGSATDNGLVRFDGTTGKLIQDSNLTLNDGGVNTTLQSSIATFNLKSNAGTSSSLSISPSAAFLFSPDATDYVSAGNGVCKLATNNNERLTVGDSGVRLGAANAFVTTIYDAADGDSSSDTILVTANWVKTHGGFEPAGAVATHAALTAAHGVGGAIVGTTDSQTLTNKTLTAPILSSGTAGSIVFLGSSAELTQDNAALFFDATNNRLSLNDNTPNAYALNLVPGVTNDGWLGFGGSVVDNGGGTVQGINGLVTVDLQAVTTNLYGINFTIQPGGTASNNLTTLCAANYATRITGSYGGQITNVIGVRVNNLVDASSGSPTYLKQIGVEVANLTLGSTARRGIELKLAAAATAFNVYASGTAQNYFKGNVGIGVVTAGALLEVQGSATVGQELVVLDQNDTDQPFIDFQGTAAANATNSLSSLTAGNSIQGFIQIEINGTKKWIPYYDDPTS